jgi:hypothetical protein
MNNAQIDRAIAKAIKSGNWMIRTEKEGGISPSRNFQWEPIGHWTTAPDWNNKPSCGHGLHGQASEAGGQGVNAKIIVFCETSGERVIIDGNKIKVPKARRLTVGKLPIGLKFESSLDLRGCDLKGITLPQSVGGSLDLSDCDLKDITLPPAFKNKIIL